MPLKLSERIQISRRDKILLGIGLSIVLLALLIFGAYVSLHEMFDWNDRFMLRKVQVKSAGWWNGKVSAINSVLNPVKSHPETNLNVTGDSNLFKLDLDKIRTGLLKEPGIRSVKVFRNLPDTLVIHIDERIPRAVIGSRRSPFLSDYDCVILSRKKTVPITASLPIILTAKPIPGFGKKFMDIKPAMELIRLSKTVYTKIRFHYFFIEDPQYVKAQFSYNGNMSDVYVVLMNSKDLTYGMDRLITSMLDLKQRGAPGRIIDLRFKNQTILKNRIK